MITEDTKANWQVLREVPAANDLARTVGYWEAMPDPADMTNISYGSNSILQICMVSEGADNQTVIGTLWGFRRGSQIAEKITDLTFTIGTASAPKNPGTGEDVTVRFADTIVIANNLWDLDTGERSVLHPGQGANGIGYWTVDTMGLSSLYFQKTGGTTTEKSTILFTHTSR